MLVGWKYRKRLTISGSSGAGTNYQVLLKVGESSGASGCDFHVDGLSANFPSDKNQSGDLRFTGNDGETLLPFWVEKVEGSAPNRVAYVWVKVNGSLDSSTDIFCYYGNSSASNVSNGDNTFEFFDDFEGTSLDTNKWLNAGTNIWSVENGNLVIESTGDNQYLVSKQAVKSYGIIIESRIKAEQAGDAFAHLGLIWHANTETGSSHRNDHVYLRPHQYGGTTNSNIQPAYFDGALTQHSDKFGSYFDWNIWYEIKVEIIDSSTIKLYGNGELWHTWENQQHSYEHVGLVAHDGGKDYFDYIKVRKYTDPEPAFSSAGATEIFAVDF